MHRPGRPLLLPGRPRGHGRAGRCGLGFLGVGCAVLAVLEAAGVSLDRQRAEPDPLRLWLGISLPDLELLLRGNASPTRRPVGAATRSSSGVAETIGGSGGCC
jgi:hypothetical protein